MPMRMPIGPSKYFDGVYVEFGRYSNGEIAILLFDEDSLPSIKATVALENAPSAVARNGVWLKRLDRERGHPRHTGERRHLYFDRRDVPNGVRRGAVRFIVFRGPGRNRRN
jgi:hypothetical protein